MELDFSMKQKGLVTFTEEILNGKHFVQWRVIMKKLNGQWWKEFESKRH